jgi:hypothetical protein
MLHRPASIRDRSGSEKPAGGQSLAISLDRRAGKIEPHGAVRRIVDDHAGQRANKKARSSAGGQRPRPGPRTSLAAARKSRLSIGGAAKCQDPIPIGGPREPTAATQVQIGRRAREQEVQNCWGDDLAPMRTQHGGRTSYRRQYPRPQGPYPYRGPRHPYRQPHPGPGPYQYGGGA